MLTNERQDKILQTLRQNGTATVREIARTLYVSEATVRRDLKQMQDLGLLKRSHGGAVLLEKADEISIFVRMTENAHEKERAASCALRHIPNDFKTVFLDSSSTVLALAQRMDLSQKTVVTNGLQTVARLAGVRGIDLVIPGGKISHTGASVAGGWTNNLLAEFHFDLMLASCAAVGEEGAFETSIEQRELKRTVFARSNRRILIADHTKFTANASYLFRGLADFDAVVFDEIPAEKRAVITALSPNVFTSD